MPLQNIYPSLDKYCRWCTQAPNTNTNDATPSPVAPPPPLPRPHPVAGPG